MRYNSEACVPLPLLIGMSYTEELFSSLSNNRQATNQKPNVGIATWVWFQSWLLIWVAAHSENSKPTPSAGSGVLLFSGYRK